MNIEAALALAKLQETRSIDEAMETLRHHSSQNVDAAFVLAELQEKNLLIEEAMQTLKDRYAETPSDIIAGKLAFLQIKNGLKMEANQTLANSLNFDRAVIRTSKFLKDIGKIEDAIEILKACPSISCKEELASILVH